MKSVIKHQTLSEGAVILVFTAIITKAIGALFKIPLASELCLGDLGFGYFSAAYDLISPIILIAVSGLPIAVSKIISGYSTENSVVKTKNIFQLARKLFFTVGLCLLLLAFVLIFIMFSCKKITLNDAYCYFAIIPSLLICALSSAYRGYFEGITNMVYPAVSSLIEALSKLLLGFLFAFATVRTTGNPALASAMALLGITIGTFLSFIYLHISFKSHSKYTTEENNSELQNRQLIKKISLIALPIAVYSLSGSVAGLIDSVTVRPQLLKLFQSDFLYFEKLFEDIIDDVRYNGKLIDMLQMPTLLYGIRGKAYTLYNIIPTLAAFLGASAVPHISNSFKTKNLYEMNSNIFKIIKITSFISIPAGIGFIALNKDIMFLLFSNSASSVFGGKMLVFYGIATIFSGISIVVGNILQAIDKQNIALINLGIGVAVKIILNIILCNIKDVNIYGCTIATAVCYVIIFILNFIALEKQSINIKKIYVTLMKFLIAALVCGIFAYTVSKLGNSSLITLISILAAVIVYLIFVKFFKIFTADELEELPFLRKIVYYFRSKNL